MNIPEGNINTLANVFTTVGGALVATGIGAGIDTPIGLALIGAGRAADLIDGPIARATGEDSELGATLDASFDKVGCAAIAFSLWRKDVVPNNVFVGMAIQNIANGIATAKARENHPDKNFLPSKTGKFAMFAQNIALLSYAFNNIGQKKVHELTTTKARISEAYLNITLQQHEKRAKISRNIGHLASTLGIIGLGVPATLGYIGRATK
jgi:phosphatidylglycerophosphate synthase